jgi:O-antigen/teichoic acid export membrane protein
LLSRFGAEAYIGEETKKDSCHARRERFSAARAMARDLKLRLRSLAGVSEWDRTRNRQVERLHDFVLSVSCGGAVAISPGIEPLMLATQTAVYFAANLFSAAFGLANTMIFTRVFAVEAYGDYLLGFAFATLLGTFLSSALKLAILREQARGEDVRGIVLAALLLTLPAAPLFFVVAQLFGLPPLVAATSTLLALAVALFEVGQEILRAEQKAAHYLRGTVCRALLVSALGVVTALSAASGAALLASSACAFLLATALFWRAAFGAARPAIDRARLLAMVRTGLPYTLSMSLMALATVADRFLLARLAGVGPAAEYAASLDLVRQALIIPAISVAAAFVPMSVRVLADEGADAARAHLARSLEFLLAVALPACVGFALVAPQVADLVLGPDFRQTARFAMPVFAMAVVFQILTQQYLHTSFLLSNRNGFYLINTGSILLFNLVVSFLLIGRFGLDGAVWGRLASEAFGCLNAYALSRRAFALPIPLGRLVRVVVATGAMAFIVYGLAEDAATLPPIAGLVLLAGAGVAVYAVAGWLLDIADLRALVGALPAARGRASPASAS